MKLEIRKEEKPSGEVYYGIYLNDNLQKAFYAGNMYLEDYLKTEAVAKKEVKKLYDNMVVYGSDTKKVTIIESTEI